jgi:ABC-type sugar transport system substrate-binding protein
MKKIIVLLLLVTMTVSLLAGCNNSKGNDSQNTTKKTDDSKDTKDTADTKDTSGDKAAKGEVKPLKYGFISWGTADEHGRTLNAAVEWAVEAAGGEFVMDGSAISAESTIAAAENLIQAGCNIIAFCTYAGEASVPQISRLCQENKVYWTMWDTTISDADIRAMIEQDPYYVGNTNEDQYDAGYKTMKAMAEAGAKNTIVVKYGVNIPTCDERVEGATAAAKELGVNLLYEIVAPEDYKKAAQDALVAYPDADSFFLAGAGSQSPSLAAAMREAGKNKFYIGAFDYFDQMGDELKDGALTIINGGHMVTGTFSALMAINAYFDTPLSEDKYMVTIPYLTLSSYEDYEAYIQYASQGAAYTSEELQKYLKVYNPDLTLESFQEGVSKWSIADIKERKGVN